jgi:hypothetical protein
MRESMSIHPASFRPPMSKRTILTLLACAFYVSLIVFIRIHPSGREVELNALISVSPAALAASLWMFATATIFVYGSRSRPAPTVARLGCLGFLVAMVAVFIAAFVGIAPRAWQDREVQMFYANLITVTTVPFIFVWLVGFWKSQRLKTGTAR